MYYTEHPLIGIRENLDLASIVLLIYTFQIMNADPTPGGQWPRCQPGTIASMAEVRSKRLARRQFLKRLAGVGATAAGLFAVTALSEKLLQPTNVMPTMPGGLACSTVHEHLVEFVADQISDPVLRASISRHIIQCEPCQNAFHQLNDGNEVDCQPQQQPRQNDST